MDEWKCVKVTASSENWTLGKIYRTDKSGRLHDDLGRARLRPHDYCSRSKHNATTFFALHIEHLTNE